MFQLDHDDNIPLARLRRDVVPFARLRRDAVPLARLRRDVPRRLLVGWLAFAALLVAAVPALGVPFGADPEAVEALLEELGDDYQILTLSDRYVLQPADREAGFRSIEIKAGSVVVDGETVTGDQLRDLVGDAAETIVSISQLGSAEWSATEELRQRIERLTEERRLKTEEIEELVRSRVEELESLEAEHLEAIEETLDERRRDERRRVERSGERHRDERQRRRRGSVRTDTRVSFGSSVTIEENETSRDVVVLGGSLDVEGKVRGDAVVVGGSAEIRGEVSGTVTAVGGSISLGPGARIDGDAISIGGAVHRDPSADVYGEITEVSLAPGFELDDVWDGIWIPHWHFDWFDFGLGELFGRISLTVVLAALLLLLVLLLPRLTTAVCERARREPWKAALVGLLAEILLLLLVGPVIVIVGIILAVTVIGLPFALFLFLFAPLALVVLFYLGLAGVAQACGHLLQDRFDWRGLNPYLLVILGVALIQGTSILGDALGIVGGPFRFIAWMVLLLGFLIKYVAWTTGLGAIMLHYLSPGRSPWIARPAPPMPAAPGPAAPMPAGPPGFVPPPPPAPTGWEETAVSTESEISTGSQVPPESVDFDQPYLAAGGPGVAGEGESEEAPVPGTVYTDEDYREAGADSEAVGGGESERAPAPETVYTDKDYQEAGSESGAAGEGESGESEVSEGPDSRDEAGEGEDAKASEEEAASESGEDSAKS